MTIWTKEIVDSIVLPVLKASETIDVACANVAKKLDVESVNYEQIKGALRKFNYGGPVAYMRATKVDARIEAAKTQEKPQEKDAFAQHVSSIRERELRSENRDLLERLREAEERSNVLGALTGAHVVDVMAREKTSGLREATAVALASDWHFEETVRQGAVAGRNSYNLEIADMRAKRFFNGVSWLINNSRSGFMVRDLVLCLLGDFISGQIHDDLNGSPLSPIEATLRVRNVLSSGIRLLLADDKLESIVIPCVHGNHGRTTKERRIKTGAETSYEWLMYNVLRDDFAHEPRVKFAISHSAHQYVNVYNFTLHATHGDELRFAGGVGGLSIPLGKRVPMWNNVRRADIHVIGHFHSLRDFRHTIVNGSNIGYSEFAMSIGAEFEEPQQAFFLLDSKRGKSLAAPIWVDNTREHAA